MKKALSLLFAGCFLTACCFVLSPSISASDSKNGATAVTFSKDVAPIFYKHCADCHRPNDMAPMSLLTYKDARAWAKAITRSYFAVSTLRPITCVSPRMVGSGGTTPRTVSALFVARISTRYVNILSSLLHHALPRTESTTRVRRPLAEGACSPE